MEFTVFAGIPNGVGIAIVEEKRVVHGIARHSEVDFFAVLFSAVHDSQVDEGSVGDGEMGIAVGIVDQFVPAQ